MGLEQALGDLEEGVLELVAVGQRSAQKVGRRARSVGEGGAQDEFIYVDLKTKEELEMLAKNWSSVSALGMTGEGACAGLPGLRARMMITLNDVGGRLSGKWYVSQVTHTIGADGYTTRFQCKR